MPAKATRKPAKADEKTVREDLLSVKEVADKLGVTERTVWNLIRAGRLDTTPIGARIWISRANLMRYRIIHKDGHVERTFSPYPSASTPGFHHHVVFGPWRETTASNLQGFKLEVTLQEWWEFAVKPVSDKET